MAPALLESVTGDPPNEKEASHFEDLCKEAISNNPSVELDPSFDPPVVP